MNFTLKNLFDPQIRKYLYRVSTAVLVLLGAIGIISDNLYVPIAGLLAAIFATSLADANTYSDSGNSEKLQENKTTDGEEILKHHKDDMGVG